MRKTGGALEFASPELGSLEARRGALLAAKIILGIGMGILMSTCQTYVSEISSPRLRTILLGIFPLFVVSHNLILEDVTPRPQLISALSRSLDRSCLSQSSLVRS
jgi:hypothetical protein